jgi:hypothetical protein
MEEEDDDEGGGGFSSSRRRRQQVIYYCWGSDEQLNKLARSEGRNIYLVGRELSAVLVPACNAFVATESVSSSMAEAGVSSNRYAR